jgi:hypothetical protein
MAVKDNRNIDNLLSRKVSYIEITEKPNKTTENPEENH